MSRFVEQREALQRKAKGFARGKLIRNIVFCVLAAFILLAFASNTSTGIAADSWHAISDGWAIRVGRLEMAELFQARLRAGMVYVIEGGYSAKHIIARIPMRPDDNIGSIYECFDMLAWKKGFCA